MRSTTWYRQLQVISVGPYRLTKRVLGRHLSQASRCFLGMTSPLKSTCLTLWSLPGESTWYALAMQRAATAQTMTVTWFFSR